MGTQTIDDILVSTIHVKKMMVTRYVDNKNQKKKTQKTKPNKRKYQNQNNRKEKRKQRESNKLCHRLFHFRQKVVLSVSNIHTHTETQPHQNKTKVFRTFIISSSKPHSFSFFIFEISFSSFDFLDKM